MRCCPSDCIPRAPPEHPLKVPACSIAGLLGSSFARGCAQVLGRNGACARGQGGWGCSAG
eukprot:10385410-Alexandrium_andersonii.AAC.1